MKPSPLVSIIVPVYNTDKFLSECIKSILAQSYRNIEVILVDDGSTDNSNAICKDFFVADRRVILVRQKNHGVSTARNRGIDIACGDFVTFIDADDTIHRDYIKNLLEDILKYNATTVTTAVKDVSGSMRGVLSENVQPVEVLTLNPKDAFRELYRGTLEGTRNGVQMFSLKLLNEYGIRYDVNMAVGEDFDFFARAVLVSNILVVDRREMYFYRSNPSSIMMQDFSLKHFEAIKNVEKIGRRVQDEIPGLEKTIDIMLFSDAIYYGAKMISARKEWPNEHKEIIRHIKEYRYMVLKNSQAKNNTRIKALMVIVLGANLGLGFIKRLIKW